MGSFSIWHWLIVLLVIILVFGTKKLRSVGEDLGGAVRGFKKGLQEGQQEPAPPSSSQLPEKTLEGQVVREHTNQPPTT